MKLPDWTFHNRTVVSYDPLTTDAPSRENATLETKALHGSDGSADLSDPIRYNGRKSPIRYNGSDTD